MQMTELKVIVRSGLLPLALPPPPLLLHLFLSVQSATYNLVAKCNYREAFKIVFFFFSLMEAAYYYFKQFVKPHILDIDQKRDYKINSKSKGQKFAFLIRW